MPANAFARNNGAKVLAVPRYLVGDVLSRVVPRRQGHWVIGSALGVHDGAKALVAEALSREHPPRVTWLARNETEAQAAATLGADVLGHGTWRAFWRALRAEVIVFTHGFGDASRFASRGALVVNLWHGSPLKRMHLDSPAAMRLPLVGGVGPVRRAMAWMYRRGTSRITLLPAAAETIVPRLRGSFGLPPGRVEVLGEPRTDVLFAAEPAELRVRARARLERSVGPIDSATVILFAPTWRDGRADPVVPTDAEWRQLEQWLERADATLIVRPHPLAVGDYARTSPRVRLLSADLEPEVMAVLHGADALITDYSSILFDFAVTGGPTVFFAPDESEYVREHGLYEPYAVTAAGQIDRTWAEVLDRLDHLLTPGPTRDDALAANAALAQRHHAFRDGGSARRVVDRILTLAAGSVTHSQPTAPPRATEVFFESFHGRNISCNPAALDREIAARLPGVGRTWSIIDSSIAVPEGATGVVRGTPEWFAARDRADLLIINDWIEDSWWPRRQQFVLQTWHGTPLKRLALARSGRTPRLVAAVIKQSARWSALLGQSESAARMLRRAYAVARPLWVEGYPRNDVIARGDDGGVRTHLGVTTPKVVVYAPTWRDHELSAQHPLDVAALADALGPTWTVVVRGHSRTLGQRDPTHGDRIIDATALPDISPLLATADVLITDYSSVMFDYSASGRPMVFYVADEQEYAQTSRGFLWDLAARAPGPLVRTTADCARAVAVAGDDQARWAARYALWRAEFNSRDDGYASRRVVDRLIAQGALPHPAPVSDPPSTARP